MIFEWLSAIPACIYGEKLHLIAPYIPRLLYQCRFPHFDFA